MVKSRKEHSLTGRITIELMRQGQRVWREVMGRPLSRKSSATEAGVDKVSVGRFEANLEPNLLALMKVLKSGAFRPDPLLRVRISKGPRTKKTRPLGIPVVRDRVAQEVLRRLLEPIFEPLFQDASFGFRPKRNCHQAIQWLLSLHDAGYLWVLDADVEGFFDHIPQNVIMQLVADKVADGNILRLLQRFLTAGVMDDGVFKPTTVGTPQGGVISPLLANIVLNQLDWALHRAGFQFARYADDFVVLTRSQQQAQEAMELVQQVLETPLQLRLSPEKTRIMTFGKGYEFLGFFLSSRSRRMRDKSQQKFKDKVRELTVRCHNLDAEAILKLNRVIRGTAQYFTPEFATNRWLFQKLDSWVRMRLRSMKLKRKNYNDNRKLRVRFFCRKLGLLSLESFCLCRNTYGQVCYVVPRNGATSLGSPGE